MNLASLNVSRETIQSLHKFQELVIKWNEKINLVSPSTITQFWERHIVDSLQLLKFINNTNVHVLDVGSGAGMPGIILSIAGVDNVTLVESDARKAAFLLQAAAISSYKINIINDRIENLNLNCDILTSRACADIDNILNLTQKININDRYLLLKGESYHTEIDSAKKNWLFEYDITDSVTLNKSKIIEIKNPVKIK